VSPWQFRKSHFVTLPSPAVIAPLRVRDKLPATHNKVSGGLVSNRILKTGAAVLLSALVIGCQSGGKDPLANPAAVTHDRLVKGTSLPNQWPSYGGGYDEQRYSPLKAINDGNVQDLGLAWYADYRTNQNQHGSPLYIDGVIYVSTARNVVHAYDARDGRELWTYHPNLIPNP